MKRHSIMIALMFIALFACDSKEVTPERRAKQAERNIGDIQIGVAWPYSVKSDLFKEGIELALEEINAQGGVMGRKIVLEHRDDQADVKVGKQIAQEFAENLDMTCVIGHYNSFISLPAAITYGYYGLLMITPGSTTQKLTKEGYSHVFRTIPTDLQIGNQAADLAAKLRYKRVVIIYEKGQYGIGLANAFELRAEELGIYVPDRFDYDTTMRNYNYILDKLDLLDFDAIFLAGYSDEASRIIVAARQRNIEAPFFGGDGLDSPNLFKNKPEVDGTMVLSVFHLDDPRPEVQEFNAKFQRKYDQLPDSWAAQGYDTLKIVALAIQNAQSSSPPKVAKAMTSIKGWNGVTGIHSFDERGNMADKSLAIKIVENGRFNHWKN